MSKPKFSWEPLAGGSLLRITVTTGARKVSWDIRKTTPPDKLRGLLGEIMTELAEDASELVRGSVPSGAAYGDHVEYVDDPEPAPMTEKESLRALTAKANSVRSQGNFWGSNDLSSLPLHELGTGEPEDE